MTTALIIAAVVIALGGIALRMMLREARNRGATEAREKGEREARKVEQEMAEDVIKDTDIDDVLDDLDNGRL